MYYPHYISFSLSLAQFHNHSNQKLRFKDVTHLINEKAMSSLPLLWLKKLFISIFIFCTRSLPSPFPFIWDHPCNFLAFPFMFPRDATGAELKVKRWTSVLFNSAAARFKCTPERGREGTHSCQSISHMSAIIRVRH